MNIVDWVNMAIGYKPFEDGLADAGVFVDDRQIVGGAVYVNKGDTERSEIQITRMYQE